MKPTTKFCPICCNLFKYWKGSNRTHCSQKCLSKAHSISIECQTCGDIFVVPKGRKSRKYCSAKCYQISKRVLIQAPKRRGYNWKPARRECIALHGGRCAMCPSPGTDVHHMTPYKYFNGDCVSANRQSNLILLCGLCHIKVENRTREIMKLVEVFTNGDFSCETRRCDSLTV